MINHLRNGLSVESIRALLCLTDWHWKGLVKDSNVEAVMREDPSEDEDEDPEDVWGLVSTNIDLVF